MSTSKEDSNSVTSSIDVTVVSFVSLAFWKQTHVPIFERTPIYIILEILKIQRVLFTEKCMIYWHNQFRYFHSDLNFVS